MPALIAILIEIWNFLVALGPLLETIGAFLVGVVGALWEIAKLAALVTALLALLDILFDPKGAQRVGQFLANVVTGGLNFVSPLVTALAPALNTVASDVAAAWTAQGKTLQTTVAAAVEGVAQDAVSAIMAVIPTGTYSTPDNATANTNLFFEAAFKLGVSSAGVTAAFEALLPERLNTFNVAGPLFATLAGFAPIAAELYGPLYRNGAGRSLEYKFRSQFRPELPPRREAEQLYARGLISAADLAQLVSYDGLNPDWEPATTAGAFRPLQPRALVSLFQDVPFPTAEVQAALVFAGYRAADIALLLPAMEYASLKDVRHQYITGEMRAAELGVLNPADLATEIEAQGWSPDAVALVQLTVATRKLVQLAELYRKSISEGYRYGTVTDAQYVPALEAIGIAAADAEAHYAVDSIAKTGKALLAAEKAAATLTKQQTRAATSAAVASYKAGATDAAGLTAALLVAGVDPEIAGYITTIQVFRSEGNLVHIYGVTLPRDQAILLRERVVALGAQVHATLVTPAAALAQLTAWKIPGANAEALVAGWAASKITAADVGVKEPI